VSLAPRSVALGALLVLASLGAAGPAQALEIRTLSNRADLISGGDALVELRGAHEDVRVDVDGRDVTGSFEGSTGLIDGLRDGRNVVTARNPGGEGARLVITNHPRSGPVIAGPQVQPWVCAAECEPATTYAWFYKSTNPARRGFVSFDPASPPSDVATTKTDDGRTVPFVIRVESGGMDRGLYAIAQLDQGWTGKVLWPFGGDCKPLHKQDTPIDVKGQYPLDPIDGPVNPGVDEALGAIFGNGNAATALSRGFLVATSSNNKLGSQCNTVVSAESILMLKEHIRERYGPIRYTIGAGGSGGAMQQHQIASAYPGLLDGLQPISSFPDLWEVVVEAQDCHLLQHAFNADPAAWADPDDRFAVLGTDTQVGCNVMFDGPVQTGLGPAGNYAGMWLDPDNAVGCGLGSDEVYPNGPRCTIPDYMVAIFGRRPKDGFANRPFDNTGVEYGLKAFRDGRISAEQFVAINESVGGLDIDWNFQGERSVADTAGLRAAYRGGLITNGRELERVPIIDIRGQDNYEIHADFHSYAMRARLDRHNGHHDNQVLWNGVRAQVGDPDSINAAFDVVDDWLARVEADGSDRSLPDKVRANKPPEAVDACWREGRKEPGCSFPYFGDARTASGAPLRDDILKCRLKPLAREDGLTDKQFARLQSVFPDGVCDWSRRGVAQQQPLRWPTFAGGPGGRALGPAPTSTPITDSGAHR
jgi:hypothetical protein